MPMSLRQLELLPGGFGKTIVLYHLPIKSYSTNDHLPFVLNRTIVKVSHMQNKSLVTTHFCIFCDIKYTSSTFIDND